MNAPAQRPLVLLTNDDGVYAPGLAALYRATATCFDVQVLAPEHNWSASGHSKTMHKPLRVTHTQLADGNPAMALSGSPSDCVAVALLGLLPRRPDLVISGINQGANVGHDLTYSGTVSAAMEAVIGGVSGMALSLDSFEWAQFDDAAAFACDLARQMITHPLGRPLLVNVNVPALPLEQIKGVRVTRQGTRIYRDELVERHDPRGRAYYWIGGEPPAGVPEEGTDIGALAEGYVSVTPIMLDLTDREALPVLETWPLHMPQP
ncbi:MAG: 5'/3'-nucleotidase SurE [Chloroflexi bacterium]|jgi:5'-nucleotidase|nr:5'/3'-nucleotidase SurE [Chloroflexota bacterium]